MNSKARRFGFDVYVSFKDEDTGKGFVGLLYEALKQHEISTFLDREALEKGARTEELFWVIEESEIFIPIFTKRYAESAWCLTEITRMVDCGRLVLPVFYDVEPRQVRKQDGPFEASFRKHELNKGLSKETVKKWRLALSDAGEIKGYDVQNELGGREEKIVQFVVKKVVDEANKFLSDVAKFPVGLDSRIKDVMEILDMESSDVRLVGIHGMGGVGKTTLAKAIFNRISSSFEACSFISDVREVSKKFKGLVSLQKKLIGDLISDKCVDINDVSEGINTIQKRVHSKRVLVVLDDVDDTAQLNALVGSRDWFSMKSKVIVTTRNEHVLNVHKLNKHEIYHVEGLNLDQSLQLFSYHAFGKEKPPAAYAELSKEAVSSARGLPLTLEVFGSIFFDMKTLDEWNKMLEKLMEVQHKDIHEKLKVSYDGLDETEKQILLDVSCFLIGKSKENAVHVWRDCGFFPAIALRVLLHKSLIKVSQDKVSNDSVFEMHDQIRDMGRQIVLDECPSNPVMRSRLWSQVDTLEVFKTLKGITNDYIQGFSLEDENHRLGELNFSIEVFAPMSKLRLLHMNRCWNIGGDLGNLPPSLKWLMFKDCPFETLTYETCNFKELVVLDLSDSWFIEQLWTGQGSQFKVFPKLKVLDLSDCGNLIAAPNFVGIPLLVKLVLDKCEKLAEIDASIGHLSKLTYLSMRHCNSIKQLPDSICQLNSLETFNLDGCTRLSNLPERIGNLQSLRHLSLHGCHLSVLPASIGNLKNLPIFSITGGSLIGLPDSIGKLVPLEKLSFDYCRYLKKIPDSIKHLRNLSRLSLKDCQSLEELPDSISCLVLLEELILQGCEMLQSLPNLPSSLMILDAQDCAALETISDTSNLKYLKKLDLTKCRKLVRINGLENLEFLRILCLYGCESLDQDLIRRQFEMGMFRHLEEFSTPGAIMGNLLSFMFPRGFASKPLIINKLNTYVSGKNVFVPFHIQVVLDGEVILGQRQETCYNPYYVRNGKDESWYPIHIEKDDEANKFLRVLSSCGVLMIHVSLATHDGHLQINRGELWVRAC